jgi:DNA-binding transcriptional regulator YhcF (GntR family)
MEFKKSESIYEQIASSIQENILDEVWKSGDRIPSVRETAGKIQVNPNTVMRTYSLLQDEGIIFNKRGIGFFISEDAVQKTIEMKKQKFNSEMLPEFFKMIDKLQISFDELKVSYKEWKIQNN